MTDKLREHFEEILQEIIRDEDNGQHTVEYYKENYLNRLLHAVAQQHQELRDKIVGMKKEICDCHHNCKQEPGHSTGIAFNYCECDEYNQAIRDVLSLLK